MLASVATVAQLYFITRYIGRRKAAARIARLGTGYLALLLTLVFLGYLPLSYTVLDNGIVFKEYGWTLHITGSVSFSCLVTMVVFLVKALKGSRDPEYRNRLVFLLTGVTFLGLFGIACVFVNTFTIPPDHIGSLFNAMVLTYAVFRHRLVDMRVIIRKSIVYAGITASIIASFTLLLFALRYLMNFSWDAPISMAFAVGAVFLMAFLFHPLRIALEKAADQLLYGSRYDYRQMVLSFTNRMSNVIEMDELAEAMLRPITRAVSTRQSSLLFQADGHFETHYAERMNKGEPIIPISIRRDGPIVAWLEENDKPLLRDKIETAPIFKALWQEERNSLDAAEVEALLPIKSKRQLIAILSLSKKRGPGYYSSDDLSMLMTMAQEAAVVIENARLYEKAKQRANTDELTGLFNHRYFHERLEEEIARCSRFGEIFSLIMMDMDLFKKYNDINGHLAGDDVLKQFGKIISQSARTIDICFRYGGDEFAVILPGTPLEGASKVAERILKSLEAQTDMKGMLQTCSTGIASWPTDGVMREELIRSADAALYYAKQTGGNRVCWACEVALSDVLRMDTSSIPQNRNVIINTIYALAATVDAKDHHTYGHSKKVAKLATSIARALGYAKEGIDRIRTAALLHDIGKIGISDAILTKREHLSTDDWELIRAHPSLGVSILKNVDSLSDCLAAVQYHHEHYDGTGYPSGLKGQNIPLDARILAVADCYDAMTSLRPYRSFKATREQALGELQRGAGTQFDPEIVRVFVNLQKKTTGVAGKQGRSNN
ncbi:MAG: diguanylate cyclase, partial [Dehalococcoidales bacterium]|jgi:diguanylate cyclase (GGDEF)-like protein/putative nucleotidyltransferase with HDIG domain